ncbi:Uncharacterised protein [Mycobacteroides abscessus]|nr:Uncharacterised protein [Mycobacteroides abscessus]
MPSNVVASIARSANVPVTNATPIVTARTERTSCAPCARTPRSAIRPIIGRPPSSLPGRRAPGTARRG